MSQWRWTLTDQAIMEVTKSLGGKWEVTFHQTSALTFVDGECVYSQDAMVVALKVVVRDLETTMEEARKKLDRAQREEVKS